MLNWCFNMYDVGDEVSEGTFDYDSGDSEVSSLKTPFGLPIVSEGYDFGEDGSDRDDYDMSSNSGESLTSFRMETNDFKSDDRAGDGEDFQELDDMNSMNPETLLSDEAGGFDDIDAWSEEDDELTRSIRASTHIDDEDSESDIEKDGPTEEKMEWNLNVLDSPLTADQLLPAFKVTRIVPKKENMVGSALLCLDEDGAVVCIQRFARGYTTRQRLHEAKAHEHSNQNTFDEDHLRRKKTVDQIQNISEGLKDTDQVAGENTQKQTGPVLVFQISQDAAATQIQRHIRGRQERQQMRSRISLTQRREQFTDGEKLDLLGNTREDILPVQQVLLSEGAAATQSQRHMRDRQECQEMRDRIPHTQGCEKFSDEEKRDVSDNTREFPVPLTEDLLPKVAGSREWSQTRVFDREGDEGGVGSGILRKREPKFNPKTAARAAQRVYRGHLGRKKARLFRARRKQEVLAERKLYVKLLRQKQAIVLQKYARRMLVVMGTIVRDKKSERRARRRQRRVIRENQAAEIVQKYARGYTVRSGRDLKQRKARQQKRRQLEQKALEHKSALHIQRVHRGHSIRQRNIIAVRRRVLHNAHACRIQAVFFGYYTRKQDLLVFKKYRRDAATQIQRVHRGRVTRQSPDLLNRRSERRAQRRSYAATRIQSVHRENTAKLRAGKRRWAIGVLQSTFRMGLARVNVAYRKRAIKLIQAHFRRILSRGEVEARKEERRIKIELRRERIEIMSRKIFLRKALEEKAREIHAMQLSKQRLLEKIARKKAPRNLNRRGSPRRVARVKPGNLVRFSPPRRSRPSAIAASSPRTKRLSSVTYETPTTRARDQDLFEEINKKGVSPRTKRLYRLYTSTYDIY